MKERKQNMNKILMRKRRRRRKRRMKERMMGRLR